MADDAKEPVKLSPEAMAVQNAKLVGVSVVLSTGKAAHLSVPTDYDALDAISLMKACIDIFATFEQKRAQGQDKGGAIQIARSLPPTRDGRGGN